MDDGGAVDDPLSTRPSRRPLMQKCLESTAWSRRVLTHIHRDRQGQLGAMCALGENSRGLRVFSREDIERKPLRVTPITVWKAEE